MLTPTFKEIAKKEKVLKDLKEKIVKAERQARRLPALKNEKEQLEKQLAKLEKQLPKDKDLPNILRTLTREALRENLEFFSISPGKAKKKKYFESIPFAISFAGSLHATIRFLASLGQEERIYKAGNMTLNPSGALLPDGTKGLRIQLQLETYAYKG